MNKKSINNMSSNLPIIPKDVSRSMNKFKKITKRMMMNEYFDLLGPLERRLKTSRYFQEMLLEIDGSIDSNRPTKAIKNSDLGNLDYLLCLQPKKSHSKKTGMNSMNSKFEDLFNAFNKSNSQVNSEVTSTQDEYGNVTTMRNTTRTANYNINLLPFIPIKLKTNPDQPILFYALKMFQEIPNEINIYYYFVRDYKYLICDKTKLPFDGMTDEEKDTLYNTIIDSAALGIDEMIKKKNYAHNDDDDQLIEELKVCGMVFTTV